MTQEHSAKQLFAGDGEIAGLMRSHDWSQTQLGAVETWSDDLKAAVQILLTELDQAKPPEETPPDSEPPIDTEVKESVKATAEQSGAARERARDEVTLRESENRFRSVANLVPDLLWRNDATGNTSWYNQRWLDYTGQTLEEARGYGWLEAIHPDDRAQSLANFRNAVYERRLLQQEHRIRGTDGNYRWFLVNTHPVLDSNATITEWFRAATDIHEQRTAFEALHETQRRLELSLKGANLGIWTYNVSTDEFWADDRAKLMHGHEPHEVHTFAEAGANIHPEDRDRAQAALVQAIEYGSKLQIEYRVVWRDGSVHGIASYAEFMQTGSQDGGMFYGVAQDLTDRLQVEGDRNRAEVALHLSEERLQTAQRAGNVGVWDWDAATGKTYWSETMWTLYGYESQPDKTIDEIWEASLHPENQLRVKEGVAQFLASNETDYRNEFRIIQPNGSVRWIEAVAQIIRDPTGKPVRMSGVNLDITSSKQAEIALAHSRYQFEKIASTTPDLVYVFDLVEESNIYVNAGVHQVLGYSQAEIASLGSSLIASLIHPDDIPGVIEGNQRFRELGDEEVYDHEIRMRHATGEYRWLRCRDTVFQRTADGTVTQTIGTAQDVTDRKRHEANLAFLAEIADDFSRLSSADELMRAVGAKVGTYLNTSNCLLAEINEEQNQAIVEYTWHTPDTPDVTGVYRLSDSPPSNP